MAEVAPAGGGGPNRIFVIIAIGLAGLLLLGVIGLAALWAIGNLGKSPAPAPTLRIAATTPTRPISTPTVAATDTEVPATLTPVIQNTQVIAPAGTAAPTSAEAATSTPATGTPGSGTLPSTGLGEDLLVLAGGVVLVLIIFAARRARSIGGV